MFRLKDLLYLVIHYPFDEDLIRTVFEELPFLSSFLFKYHGVMVAIHIAYPKEYNIFLNYDWKKTVGDLNAAIQFIQENVKEESINEHSGGEDLIAALQFIEKNMNMSSDEKDGYSEEDE